MPNQNIYIPAGGGAPSGAAGGDLTGTYPNPTIKTSVGLTGIPTAPTAGAGSGSTQIATTAYVQTELSSLVQTIVVDVSSAEILNLFLSPKTLVSAQGAGTIILPIAAILIYTYGTTTYTSGSLRIIENSSPAVGASLFTNTQGINGVTTSYNSNFIPSQTLSTSNIQVNQPLQLWAAISNPTVGDGTMKIILTYKVVTI